MADKPELVAEFDKCPVCGGKRRFCEELAKEVKEKGWMRPELNFYIQIWKGAVHDEQWDHKVPIGSKYPAYFAYLDVCLDCGSVYASKIERGTGVKMGVGRTLGDLKISGPTQIPPFIKKEFGENGPTG